VGLNFILIPKLGAMGAAMVTAISFFFCPAIAALVSQKYYTMQYNFGRIFKMLLVALLFYFICSHISTDFIFVNILIKLLIILTYPIVLYLFGFFDSKEVVFIKEHLHHRFGLAS
jgi:O-antigen/teichoic acid export membrane protein